jgi:hypothetical protein
MPSDEPGETQSRGTARKRPPPSRCAAHAQAAAASRCSTAHPPTVPLERLEEGADAPSAGCDARRPQMPRQARYCGANAESAVVPSAVGANAQGERGQLDHPARASGSKLACAPARPLDLQNGRAARFSVRICLRAGPRLKSLFRRPLVHGSACTPQPDRPRGQLDARKCSRTTEPDFAPAASRPITPSCLSNGLSVKVKTASLWQMVLER